MMHAERPDAPDPPEAALDQLPAIGGRRSPMLVFSSTRAGTTSAHMPHRNTPGAMQSASPTPSARVATKLTTSEPPGQRSQPIPGRPDAGRLAEDAVADDEAEHAGEQGADERGHQQGAAEAAVDARHVGL